MTINYDTRPPSDTSALDILQKSLGFHGPRQRWPSQTLGSTKENMDGCEDIIEDDYDSFDELFTQHFTDENLSKLTPSAPQKKPRSNGPAPTASSQQKAINATRRFVLPPENKFTTPQASKEDKLPWAEKYAPINLEELAVHKRKVCDVERWLNDALAGSNRRKLLILRGPAGCGKSTTISLLSHSLQFDILEWKTPLIPEFTAKGYVSLAVQFDEFLSRGNGFGSLDLDGDNESRNIIQTKARTSQRRIILVEEFPTWSGRNASSLAAFRLSLLRYISMSTPSTPKNAHANAGQPAASPIVMIVSETFSGSAPLDNLTVYRLVGHEIYNHPSTTIIDFNSIAPSFMYKALSLVLEKNAGCSKRKQAAVPSLLEGISKIGDIRNAIASLEFICLDNDTQSSRSKGANKSMRSSRTRKILTPSERETLKAITQREANLGLFHAVGKIVYNKRDSSVADAEILRLPPPPNHLARFNRPEASQVSVNELVDETGTDSQSFISALHENYVPSCYGPSFTDCLDECIMALSDSDLLCADQKGHGRFRAGLGTGIIKPGASIDLLRQNDISYQVAARGLLFALPSPVKRQISFGDHPKRMSDSHKMFSPPTFRLLQQVEEIQSYIDMWTCTFLDPSRRPDLSRLTSRKTPHINKESDQASSDVKQPPGITMISRKDILLYQLPYMAMLLGDEAESMQVRRITSFSGIETRTHGKVLQEDERSMLESSCSDQGPLARVRGAKRQRIANIAEARMSSIGQEDDGKLFLSEDDIVDDF
ncbi:hypothetical protein ARAM_005754 [Aspergillus rambellii]|uniref:Checkpoint protein RAD24-like helical bundle domain-containing protein n=1 Tax=Aspergillus rambellii TaxID=308745 RepID=A0A0F8VIF5_9EURO|nr:hypothetical protein ARAM_005754 [Aspergillus rambellii]